MPRKPSSRSSTISQTFRRPTTVRSSSLTVFILYCLVLLSQYQPVYCKVGKIALRTTLLPGVGTSEVVSISKTALPSSWISLRGGFGGTSYPLPSEEDEAPPSSDRLKLSGVPKEARSLLEGVYHRRADINRHPHYEKELSNGEFVHLYWTGSQWVLHFDTEPAQNLHNLLAYAKIKAFDPRMSSGKWFVRIGKSFEMAPLLGFSKAGSEKDRDDEAEEGKSVSLTADLFSSSDEFLGVPKKLIPYYFAFMLDAIAVGLVMPLLPFAVMELGANAFQLSLVVSSNYVAQSIGCIVMGKVSDMYGRRLVMLMCLFASATSYFCLSRMNSLVGIALARIISGSFGGLLPVMQSTVADSAAANDRPKYLGRIMAVFGLGFVLGPGLSAALPSFSTRQKILLASCLPFLGFLSVLFFAVETKKNAKGIAANTPNKKLSKISPAKVIAKEGSTSPVPLEIALLVLNGFAIMYAFASETIYAMFIKESFGYGEHTLSKLFASNGMFIGIFQVFLIKPLINNMGKYATLGFGNILLSLGMMGVGLVRHKVTHFVLFTLHIIGYSIADTALASLITSYSSPATQGRDLAMNQAAQSCARVLGPLLAGFLYEVSKQVNNSNKQANPAVASPLSWLPSGALPFLAGALLPAMAVLVPLYLYIIQGKTAEDNNPPKQKSRGLFADFDKDEDLPQSTSEAF